MTGFRPFAQLMKMANSLSCNGKLRTLASGAGFGIRMLMTLVRSFPSLKI